MTAAVGSFGVLVGLLGALGALLSAVAPMLARRRTIAPTGAPSGQSTAQNATQNATQTATPAIGAPALSNPLLWIVVMAAGIVVAVVAMEVAILSDNFSVAYVARNSSAHTPLAYKVATLWGALEGSILLWVLVLCGYTGWAGWRFRARLSDPLVRTALAVMAAVCVFFFGLLAGPANPFVTLEVAPTEGGGLNPLLQNHPLMVIHPVMLYLGYVGFTLPFAFAVAALITGRAGERWLADVRRPTLLAWGSLGIGIVLGAWWSYEVLGWGGYWAWDPVENASLLPWLTSTAFIHSLLVQQRRQMLRVWNVTLLLASFALTIFGTFLTRSGVLDSVHEFSESQMGPLLLGFFAVVVIGSVVLVAWRAPTLTSPGALRSAVSREGSFLANNLAFSVAAFVVLLGTVFPLLVEAVTSDQLAVGRPYFDRMLAPIGLVLLALMSVSPSLQWRTTAQGVLLRRLLSPVAFGVMTMLVALAAGAHGLWSVLALGLAGSTVGAAGALLVRRVRAQGLRGLAGSAGGGMVAHLAVGLIAFGLIASSAYDAQGEFTLGPGESAQVAGHQVTVLGLERSADGPNDVVRVAVEVAGRGVHHPAVTRFATFGQPISTPSVATSLVDDVYVSLVTLPVEGSDEVTLRVLVKPMVIWLWIGGGVLAAGVVLAMLRTGRLNYRRRDRRNRDSASPARARGVRATDALAAGSDQAVSATAAAVAGSTLRDAEP